MKTDNELTSIIIGKAIEVHRQLGPGLLESVYQECLFYELDEAGLCVEKEVVMPVIYKKLKLNQGFRMDLLVENRIVVEIKTVERLNDIHTAQLLTYLTLGGYKLGLLINFKETTLRRGIKRLVN